MATWLYGEDIVDITRSTLRDLGPPKFSQIAQSLTRYEIVTKWFKKDKMVIDSGYGIQRNLMVRTADSARHVALNDEDSTTIADLLEQIQVPWKYVTTSWGFHYNEFLDNRGKALILNVFEPRRCASMLDLIGEIEEKSWSAPASTTTKDPYGIPYWIVKNSSTGFNGGYPTGHSALAGLDLTNAPNFKNYTAQYASANKTDLVKKMRTGKRKTNFISPVTVNDYRGSTGANYRYYTNETTLAAIEDIGEAQNENLGRDIASMDGQMVFHGNPLIYVPQLDSDTQNPVYQIDHTTFYPVVKKGNWMRESDVIRDPKKHDWFYIPTDCAYNFLCIDRRRNAVYATA